MKTPLSWSSRVRSSSGAMCTVEVLEDGVAIANDVGLSLVVCEEVGLKATVVSPLVV